MATPHVRRKESLERTYQLNVDKARGLTRKGRYHEAIWYLGGIYTLAKKTGRTDQLSREFLRMYFPMPRDYVAHVIKSMPRETEKFSRQKKRDIVLTELAMIHQESKFNIREINRETGAKGLMQILPGTGRWVARSFLGRRYVNLFDPRTNMEVGTTYLDYLFDRAGGYDHRNAAVASWIAGPNTIGNILERGITLERGIRKMPNTRGYLAKVNENFRMYTKLYGPEVEAMLTGPSENKAVAKKPEVVQVARRSRYRQDTTRTYYCKGGDTRSVHPATVQVKPIFRVQIGAFGNYDAASKLKKDVNEPNVHIIAGTKDGKKIYKVQVWFNNKAEAESYLTTARTNGHSDAWQPG